MSMSMSLCICIYIYVYISYMYPVFLNLTHETTKHIPGLLCRAEVPWQVRHPPRRSFSSTPTARKRLGASHATLAAVRSTEKGLLYIPLLINIQILIYIYIYIYMYVCTYVRMYVCMYVCTYVRTYVRMYVCMYVCIYVFLCIHILYIYVYIQFCLKISAPNFVSTYQYHYFPMKFLYSWGTPNFETNPSVSVYIYIYGKSLESTERNFVFGLG